MGIIKELRRTAAVAGLTIAFACAVSLAEEARYDVLIRGGTVIDGSGGPGFAADVGVRDGKIVFVGSGAESGAETLIDASGLVVAPGSIDPHNHADISLEEPGNRLVANFIHQGVTTLVGGPDGWYAPSVIRKFKDNFGGGGLGPNLALYVGHNGIRKEVMGNARRPPTGEELARMRALVREGMKLGAVGLSTGLMYEPGMFSDTDEVAALAEEVASFGGIYDSHVRDPVNAFLDSHAEVIEIGRRAGIPVKLGHLKGVALHNEGLIGQVIAMVDKARLEGRVVVSDQYPYDGAATALLNDVVVVPREQVVTDPSAARIEPARLKELLRNPAQRLRLKEASENGIDGGFAWLKVTGYDAMRVVFAPDNPQLVGRYLIHIAEERSVEPFDAIADLIIENDRSIRVTLGAVTEEDVRTLLVQPWNMICSDGLYVGKEGSDNTHPRSTGSFSRILGHYTRELGLLSLPEAVRKMTSLPADFLRLYDRGRIATGKVADIVVFDAARIAARSTWAEPNLYPIGIDHVIVNGVAVLRDGELTGKRPGRFIERQSR